MEDEGRVADTVDAFPRNRGINGSRDQTDEVVGQERHFEL